MLLPLTLANLKMIIRNRQALFWALAFPLIFVAVFGLFNLDDPPNTTILVVDRAQDQVSKGIVDSLATLQNFTVDERQDETAARKELEDGEFRYLLLIPQGLAESVEQRPAEPVSITLLYDRASSTAPIILGVIQRFVEESNKRLVQAPTLLQLKPEGVQSRQLNYFDFLLPGFVGMGVMTYSIIGLASTMAVYREQKILKRILATPLRVRTFFAAQISAFLLLSLAQAAIILAAGIFIFGAHVYGNFLYLFLLVVVANIVFLNLGFIVRRPFQERQGRRRPGQRCCHANDVLLRHLLPHRRPAQCPWCPCRLPPPGSHAGRHAGRRIGVQAYLGLPAGIGCPGCVDTGELCRCGEGLQVQLVARYRTIPAAA